MQVFFGNGYSSANSSGDGTGNHFVRHIRLFSRHFLELLLSLHHHQRPMLAAVPRDFLHSVHVLANARQCHRAMEAEQYDHTDGFGVCVRAMYDRQFGQQLEDLVGGSIELVVIAPPYFLFDTRIDPVAVCMFAHRPGTVNLLHYWIAPHCRGRGLGRAYYRHFERFIRETYRPRQCTATAYNDVVGFWLRVGFTTDDDPREVEGCVMVKKFSLCEESDE